MSDLRILIAGGGTGGHIIPALAVAHELANSPQCRRFVCGHRRAGLRSASCPKQASAFVSIYCGPAQERFAADPAIHLCICPAASVECKRLIREFQPERVFGVGGYASGPGMAAALMMKVPTMAFEPNAMPGFANRLVGKRVQAAAVNFPAARKWFRNAEVTGIPVRPGFFQLEPPARTAPHLLVFGGSQGARIFNTHLPKIIAGAARCGSRADGSASERRAPL